MKKATFDARIELRRVKLEEEKLRIEREKLELSKAPAPPPAPISLVTAAGEPLAGLGALAAALKGNPGQRGETGLQGPKGEQGLLGPEGPQGRRGMEGPRGDPGLNGRDGAKGPRGETGPAGPQGPQGVAGEGFKWRGPYVVLGAYDPQDVVEFEGSSWIAKRKTGELPRPGAVDWDLMAQKGADGASGGLIGSTGEGGGGSEFDPTDLEADIAALELADVNLSERLDDLEAGVVDLGPLEGRVTDLETDTHVAATIGTANGLSLVGQALSLAAAVAGGANGALLGADKTKLDALSGTNSGDVSIGTANGLSLVGQTLSMAAAGAASAGAMTTGTQTIAGAKTFTGSTYVEELMVGDGFIACGGNASAIALQGNATNAASAIANKFTNGSTLSASDDRYISVWIRGGFNPTEYVAYVTGKGSFLTAGSLLPINNVSQDIGGSGAVWNQLFCKIYNDASNNNRMILQPFDQTEHYGAAINGATAYGHKMGNKNSLSTAGAKIVGFFSDQGSTERAYIDKDGGYVTAAGTLSGSNLWATGGGWSKVVSNTQSLSGALPTFWANGGHFTVGVGGTSDGAIALSYDASANYGYITTLAPGVATKGLGFRSNKTIYQDLQATPVTTFEVHNETGAIKFIGVAAASLPAGTAGMVHYDTTSNVLRIHNGTAWKTITHT